MGHPATLRMTEGWVGVEMGRGGSRGARIPTHDDEAVMNGAPGLWLGGLAEADEVDGHAGAEKC
jgi:hypothetical protein